MSSQTTIERRVFSFSHLPIGHIRPADDHVTARPRIAAVQLYTLVLDWCPSISVSLIVSDLREPPAGRPAAGYKWLPSKQSTKIALWNRTGNRIQQLSDSS